MYRYTIGIIYEVSTWVYALYGSILYYVIGKTLCRVLGDLRCVLQTLSCVSIYCVVFR